jgi:hypothetical protein
VSCLIWLCPLPPLYLFLSPSLSLSFSSPLRVPERIVETGVDVHLADADT